MKAIVLEMQQELFETSVLEQSSFVEFRSYVDIVKTADASGFMIGQKGIDEYTKTLSALCKAFYHHGRALVLVNPPAGVDLGVCLDAPASIYVRKRKASSVCRSRIHKILPANAALEIWSDGIIESALSAGIECVDDEERCILLRYQPKNTSGAVFITTLKLLSYSAMTTETDREELLRYLLSWNNTDIPAANAMPDESAAAIEPHILTAVAVITYALNDFEPSKIAAAIPRFFDVEVDEATIRKAWATLQADLAIASLEAIPTVLEDYIAQTGLYAYAREMKELLQEEEPGL